MKIDLWSVIILLLWLIVNCQSFDLFKRSLATCSGYTSCSSCISDVSWTYLNGACASSSSSTVANDAYSFSTESAYWSSYTSSGYIYLNSSGSNSLSLNQLSGTSVASHPTCYWRIINPYSLKINLQIQRSSISYEDIYVYYSSNYSNYFMSNKDLMNCSSSFVSLAFTNVTSLYIKVKRLSAYSSYIINMSTSNSQSLSSSNDSLSSTVQIIIIVSIIILLVIVLTLIFFLSLKCK